MLVGNKMALEIGRFYDVPRSKTWFRPCTHGSKTF